LILVVGDLADTSEQAAAKRQKHGAFAVGEKAEVSDADESLWKQVQEESAQKLVGGECHGPLPVAMSPVSPEECDFAIHKGNQAMVGNGDPMGIPAQIAENMFRAAERWLAMYDPFVTEQLTNKGVEDLRVR
jgi:hypothetical protein